MCSNTNRLTINLNCTSSELAEAGSDRLLAERFNRRDARRAIRLHEEAGQSDEQFTRLLRREEALLLITNVCEFAPHEPRGADERRVLAVVEQRELVRCVRASGE